ncbi:DUF6402 family protein [Cupriavidus sp. SW-Y-13]|uniref:DUF6402 family protein n=1 Tax=Cupriavidus sp. SW-Y-13 TaxID=2653854 RepID=UPI001365361F|nr:DUF6402 family protein [Cupriavidus sp. SW-Y-13]MWL86334.1 hypothetical protein [Cupriavidus sp. SW-Y-13]
MSFEDPKEFKPPQPYIRNKLDPIFAIERRWKLYDGRHACTPMDIRDFGISLHKAPPPIFDWRYHARKDSDNAVSKGSGSKDESVPPPVRPTCFLDSYRASEARRLAPFDLYDLPAAMRAEDFPVAASFAERWLNGRLFDAHRFDYTTNKMVEGRYDADMIDTHTIKLRWLLGFGGVESKFNRLQRDIYDIKARAAIQSKLRKYLESRPKFSGMIDTLADCQGDLQKLHADFQFQYIGVGMSDAMVGAPVSRNRWLSIGMTDVSAALGKFNFYATVGKANVVLSRTLPNPSSKVECFQRKAIITDVLLYMRDSYSFHDKGPASQYLGHWNKRGMILLPAAAVAHFMAESLGGRSEFFGRMEVDDMALLPVTVKDRLEPENVYYPIRNRDFRAWQAKHRRGGDFLIYSDLGSIRLKEPLHIDLGVIC